MRNIYNSKKLYKSAQKFSSVIVRGVDAQEFLQRQLTNDLNKLAVGSFQLNARLDRNGRIHSFFYLVKNEDQFLIISQPELQDSIISELDKFLIMEEVEIVHDEREPKFYFGFKALDKTFEDVSRGNYLNLPALISFVEIESEGVSDNDLEELYLLSAWPSLGHTITLGTLINDTRLNELAVDYKKGCFLGQETVSKIETRRGAAKYPCWVSCETDFSNEFQLEEDTISGTKSVKFNDKFYKEVNLQRKHRVNGKEYFFDGKKLIIHTSAPLGGLDHTQLADDLYHRAIEIFHYGDEAHALELIQSVQMLNPKFADAYEVKGAILGQQNKFQEAIDVMDELLEVDPDSVMAHTNKSLYLMKLGKIEEAEEEKSLATVASFKKFGDEAKLKKEIEAKKQQELEDLKRREGMFYQVLEIDPEDDIANFGLADIFYKRDDYENALAKVEVVLNVKPKYSQAYLLKGKILEALKDYHVAIDVYKAGIEIASTQGEMMPANEMQSRMNSLKNIL
ncbi:tetratricopeptide repeat protein [Bacteriovorax sp. Seq25_V]|uniref:tetratricopeptide repeat protein n=1 Tax=Bacteriovorax sp. Seq25_V TaxID=1201288 RepID=UPI00038A0634|nr:tetratricopeptide repeat protein [Bacteriovorax sp. Seq25_V]EQC43201.1 folate-binding protein YgfZ [Bacteriovorax sp. Seq25_V]